MIKFIFSILLIVISGYSTAQEVLNLVLNSSNILAEPRGRLGKDTTFRYSYYFYDPEREIWYCDDSAYVSDKLKVDLVKTFTMEDFEVIKTKIELKDWNWLQEHISEIGRKGWCSFLCNCIEDSINIYHVNEFKNTVRHYRLKEVSRCAHLSSGGWLDPKCWNEDEWYKERYPPSDCVYFRDK